MKNKDRVYKCTRRWGGGEGGESGVGGHIDLPQLVL
jgi:hypothetical protein